MGEYEGTMIVDDPSRDTNYERLLQNVIFELINSEPESDKEKGLLVLMRIYAQRIRDGE